MRLFQFAQENGHLSDAEFLEGWKQPVLMSAGLEDSVAEIYPLAHLTLGRSQTCEIRVYERRVSSRHAEFVPPGCAGQSWLVRDLGSKHGTFLNGKLLTPHEPEVVPDEALVRFGPLGFTFFMPETLLPIMRSVLEPEVREDLTQTRPMTPL